MGGPSNKPASPSPDKPASGNTMSITNAFASAKAEFARHVKDSEEVMETLEVTSLAEIREISSAIVATNRENAYKALEKTRSTVTLGTWHGHGAGVAPLAGANRNDRKGKGKSGKAASKSAAHDESNVKSDGALRKVFDSPTAIALRDALARRPPDDGEVGFISQDLRRTSQSSGKQTGGRQPTRAAPADLKKQDRSLKKKTDTKPAKRQDAKSKDLSLKERKETKPVTKEDAKEKSFAFASAKAVAPLVSFGGATQRSVGEKAEQMKRVADDTRSSAEARAEQARLAAEHIVAEARRKAETTRRAAELTTRRVAETIKTVKPAEPAAAPATRPPRPAPATPPRGPPTLAEREIALRKQVSQAQRAARDAASKVAREKYELERRAKVRERSRQQRALDAAEVERVALKQRDAEIRALEEEKIQRELERSVKFAEVARAKRVFRENRQSAQTKFEMEEAQRVLATNKAIEKLIADANTKKEKEKAQMASRTQKRLADTKQVVERRRLEKEELDALRTLTSAMKEYDEGLALEAKTRDLKVKAMKIRHGEASARLKEARILEENKVAVERETDAKDRAARDAELERERTEAVVSSKKIIEDSRRESTDLERQRRVVAAALAKTQDLVRKTEEQARERTRKLAVKEFEQKKGLAAAARVAKEIEIARVRKYEDAAVAKQKAEARRVAVLEEAARKKQEEKHQADKLKKVMADREQQKKDDVEKERNRFRAMTPQQREREVLKKRAAKVAERDARGLSGELRSAFAQSVGALVGNACAGLLIGAAFGAGSYLALKGAGATHRALTERSHRRSGVGTPKPPRAPTTGKPAAPGPGQTGSAGSAHGNPSRTTRSTGSTGNTPTTGNTPVGTPRSSEHASPKSPNDGDLDDIDLVSPLHSQRDSQERTDVRPREVKKPPGVPRLHLNRITGEPSPMTSAETTERTGNAGPGNGSSAGVSNPGSGGGSGASTQRTAEVSDMSHLESSLPNTARRAADALDLDKDLKQQLETAQARLAMYEKVVASERRAKMASVEHAAKLAKAAEALAFGEDELFGASPQLSPRFTETPLESPSTRDGDDAAALASMREKERAQYEKAEAAIAKATASRVESDKKAEEERLKWERVLSVANAEALKAAEAAAQRETDLREMFAKQKGRTDSLNEELKVSAAASKKADALVKESEKKAKAAVVKLRLSRAAQKEEAEKRRNVDLPPGQLTPRTKKLEGAEKAAKVALAESKEASKLASDATKDAAKKTKELGRVTKAAEREIKGATAKAEQLKLELEGMVADARAREKQHVADMKKALVNTSNLISEHQLEVAFAKKEANKKVERVSNSAAADLKSALEREKKLRLSLRDAVRFHTAPNRSASAAAALALCGPVVADVCGSPEPADPGQQRSLQRVKSKQIEELNSWGEFVSKHNAQLEELRKVHAADLEKRTGSLRATREQLQKTSVEVAELREAQVAARAKAVATANEALQDAVSLAVASGAKETDVVKAMRKRGVTVERLETGELRVVK